MIPLTADLPLDLEGLITLLTIVLIAPGETAGFAQAGGGIRIQTGNEKEERPTQKFFPTPARLREPFSTFLPPIN